MKAQPVKRVDCGWMPCSEEEGTHLYIKVQGPFPDRWVPYGYSAGCWAWNGDVHKPTLKPSLKWSAPMWEMDGIPIKEIICHSWITDGKIEYLSDSTHELAGQTLDLLDLGG